MLNSYEELKVICIGAEGTTFNIVGNNIIHFSNFKLAKHLWRRFRKGIDKIENSSRYCERMPLREVR